MKNKTSRNDIKFTILIVVLLLTIITLFFVNDAIKFCVPESLYNSATPTTASPTQAVPTTFPPTSTPIITPTSSASDIDNSPSYIEISGLVPVLALDDKFDIELKYATTDNFTGVAIYPAEIAVLNKETAQMLIQANEIFLEDGYNIKIWDAYRPLHVQEFFWEIYPDPKYVAKPPEDELSYYPPSHNNGMSVDLTLVDLYGNELVMPSEFDDFSSKASASYPDMSSEAKENVEYLISVMESVGFKNYSAEWWHFNDTKTQTIPFMDISLEDFID